MPVPKSVIKIKKDGIEYISSVERTKYLLEELQRAALRDTAKLIRKRTIVKLKELPGMRKNSKRLYNALSYWVRKRETDLQIGFGNIKRNQTGDAWYAIRQELGKIGKVGRSSRAKMPEKSALQRTVMENINEIRRIQGAYLSSIENENRALGLIDADGNPYYDQKDER